MSGNHMDETYPEWKHKLMDKTSESDVKQTIDDEKQDYFISPNEVALKHPETGATVRLNDDGSVDIFADDTLGIRLDPTTQSVNIYGENVNIFSKKLNLKTKADGFVWNDHYFNPQVHYEDSKERDQYVTGDKEYWVYNEEEGWHWERQTWRYKPMVKTSGRTRYSDGMLDILTSLGLPVE